MSIEDGVKPAGYVQVVPYNSKSAMTNFYGIKPLAFDAGDFFAPCDVVDTGISWSQSGLAGSVDRTSGVAWKLKGYASVDLTFIGYGRHNVLDEQGKPLLSFDIQTLKPVATPTLRR